MTAIPASLAFVLGAVLASTDPVAVSALGRRLSLPPKVQALVQAESLFNDATSLVLFQIAVSLAVAGTASTAVARGVLLHVSPVMAVIIAGLVIGGRRERITTAQTRLQLHSVYQTVIFLLESVVFSLIGLQLPTLIRDLSRTEAWPPRHSR